MNTKIIKTGLLNGLLVVVALVNLLVGQAQAASEVTFYHHDALGSTIASSDIEANIHWNEEYQPYGEKIYGLGKDSITGNQDWYTGKNYDEDLDLTYFGARWYDAKQGRFLSIDPVGVSAGNIHSFGRYHYANNNPYKFVDPDGRAGKTVIPILTPAQVQAQVSSAARGLPSNAFRPRDIQKQIETNNFKNVPVPKGTGGKADFIVNSNGTAVRNSASGARRDLDAGGFPGRSTTQTAENGTLHRGVPGRDGPMDVRIMDGQAGGGAFKGPRVRTTRSGSANDGVRSDGSRFRNKREQWGQALQLTKSQLRYNLQPFQVKGKNHGQTT